MIAIFGFQLPIRSKNILNFVGRKKYFSVEDPAVRKASLCYIIQLMEVTGYETRPVPCYMFLLSVSPVR